MRLIESDVTLYMSKPLIPVLRYLLDQVPMVVEKEPVGMSSVNAASFKVAVE